YDRSSIALAMGSGDRVALMIAIMLYVAPMWYQKNREIYKDMRDATHTLFKNDREGFLKTALE
ncbi:hypothetical protein, partial [Klebsiella aerogenes]|uniref:hypothetical protein n=1 Tax=Klebsiella aerogenes TaxID=548 RepID=UPI0019544FE5